MKNRIRSISGKRSWCPASARSTGSAPGRRSWWESSIPTRLRTLAYSPHSQIKAELAKAGIGLDRAVLLVELSKTGLSESEVVALSPDYSLGRLFRMLEQRRRQDSEESQARFSDRYLVIQPSVSPQSERSERWGESP